MSPGSPNLTAPVDAYRSAGRETYLLGVWGQPRWQAGTGAGLGREHPQAGSCLAWPYQAPVLQYDVGDLPRLHGRTEKRL